MSTIRHLVNTSDSAPAKETLVAFCLIDSGRISRTLKALRSTKRTYIGLLTVTPAIEGSDFERGCRQCHRWRGYIAGASLPIGILRATVHFRESELDFELLESVSPRE